jgi:DNA polymerase I-like protein with 3'-5' exonuclease and polymerase domains
MELRLAAEISGDRVMTQAYQDGVDLHLLTASLVTGKPLEDVTKGDRQIAKSLNFGLIYGMGSGGLQAYAQASYGVQLSMDQAEEFRDKFFKAYPGLARWHQKTGNTLRNLKPGESYQTRTLAGRKRDFAEPKITTALNSPVQGSGADITKLALAKLKRRLTGFEAKIIGVVHDEIIVEVAAEQAEAVAAILSECMVQAGQQYLKSVPTEAEAAIGLSWADKG